MNYYNAIDVSEWNGDIDFTEAYNDDVRYCFIRCGFGKTGIDKYFEINMEKAYKAGIKIGIYFYSYATNYDEAVEEAKHCIDIIEPYKYHITFPVFYDVEEEKNKPHITDVVMGFINTMNYYGYNCGVYTMGAWYSQYFKDISCDYIWLAYWGADDGIPHNKPDYCDIWQYTSKGWVAGINTCDCDILYNTDMKLLIHNEDDPPDEVKTVYVDITAPEGIDVKVNIRRE